MIISIAAVLLTLAARMLGPGDLYDQTQPKTVSYTTDILANGRWLLPVERGEWPATKPPLYNWLAAPFVALMGTSSELAHKFPSVLAFLICWAVIVRLGRTLDHDPRGTLGWVAGIAFALNYTMFKLAWLARPDMLLTLWLLVGWVSVTSLLVAGPDDRRSQFGRQLLFWSSVGLAALTKGPAALAIVFYAIVAARLIGGSWRSLGRLGWWWGLPLALAMAAAWMLAAWRIDPRHFQQVLWHDEIYGRITGTGPEGPRTGLTGWVQTLPNMPLYFLVRFLPWSIPALLGLLAIWLDRVNICSSRAGRWRWASMLLIVLVVALFTLSAGKRADYIAIAYAPGALIAAWYLLDRGPRLLTARPWITPALAILALVVMIVVNERDPEAPSRRFGDVIDRFVQDAARTIARDPQPIVFWNAGGTHVQAMLGASVPDGSLPVAEAIESLPPGERLWVVAGTTTNDDRFPGWLDARGYAVRCEEMVVSGIAPRKKAWPGQLWLYAIERLPSP